MPTGGTGVDGVADGTSPGGAVGRVTPPDPGHQVGGTSDRQAERRPADDVQRVVRADVDAAES